MLKKFIIGLVLVVLLIGSHVVHYFVNKSNTETLTDAFNEQISGLNAQIAEIGPLIDAYTVVEPVKYGDVVRGELLKVIKVPASSLSEENILTIEDLDLTYFRISMNPGTVLTKDLLMREYSDMTTRERNITVDYYPVGLQPGDYVDLRLAFPEGQDFVFLSHVKVLDIVGETITINMNAIDAHVYRGALNDYYLTQNLGTTIYAVKYVDPGIQTPSIIDYVLPYQVQDMLQQDPNILDNGLIPPQYSTDRQIIEALLKNPTAQETYQSLNAGVKDYIGKMRNAYEEMKNRMQEEEADAALEEDGFEDSGYNLGVY